MITHTRYIFIFCLTWVQISSAQTIPDSLVTKYNKAKTPKAHMVALADLAYGYMYINPDTSLELSSKAISLAEKLKLLPEAAQYEYEKAIYFQIKSDFKNALAEYDISIYHFKRMTKSADKKIALKGLAGIAKAVNNKGNIYFEMGKYAQALAFFYEGLAKSEKANDKKGQADNLKGIANVYLAQDRFEKAIADLQRGLKLAKESNYKLAQGTILGTIGTACYLQQKYDEALGYFELSYSTALELGDVYSQAVVLGNMAGAYNGKGLYEKGESSYNKALALYQMMGQYTNVAITSINLGNIELRKKNRNNAEKYFLQAVALCDSVGANEVKLTGLKFLYRLYDSTQQYAPALEYYRKYIALRNDINSDENTRKQTEIELNYAYGQKKTRDSLELAAKKSRMDEAQQLRLKTQNIYVFAGAAGILVMVVISFISLRSFREKKKANEAIALQKSIVEQKQQEVLDSIHYAKRIQNALLPSENNVNQKIKKLVKK